MLQLANHRNWRAMVQGSQFKKRTISTAGAIGDNSCSETLILRRAGPL